MRCRSVSCRYICNSALFDVHVRYHTDSSTASRGNCFRASRSSPTRQFRAVLLSSFLLSHRDIFPEIRYHSPPDAGLVLLLTSFALIYKVVSRSRCWWCVGFLLCPTSLIRPLCLWGSAISSPFRNAAADRQLIRAPCNTS